MDGLWRRWRPCRMIACRICIGFSSIEIEAFRERMEMLEWVLGILLWLTLVER